jgi:5-bromo-4-chloroindolyl phosphate hydrolysis protein
MRSRAKPYKPNQLPSLNKGVLLYLFLIPLFLSVILALLQTNIMAFVANAVAFVLFFTVAKLSKKGFEQERAYLLATLTKAPDIPYKLLSALLLGVATLFAIAIAGGGSMIDGLFLGGIAIAGYYLYYGFDPKEDKLENLGNISAEFVLETIEEAQGKLARIDEKLESIGDTTLTQKLSIAVKKAEYILDTIQKDPKDIRVARKFLIVYIDGIARVIDSYVSLDEGDIDASRRQKLYGLVEELEEKFDRELERLKRNNLFDLDVNIDVLQEQIK